MPSTSRLTVMPLRTDRSRPAVVLCIALVAAVTFLSLYISAAIALTVPLTSLINLLGLAAAITLWFLPRTALKIVSGALLAAIAVLQIALSFDLLAICLLTIVGALALLHRSSGLLYLGTGVVALMTGWSGIRLSLNGNLVPRLFTEAVPGIDLNLPPLLASWAVVGVALVFLSIGVWRCALRLDVLAVAALVAAASYLAASILGYVSMGLPPLLATLYPSTYEFDDESLAMMSTTIDLLTTRGKDLILGAIFPIVLGIVGIVRLVQQPSHGLHGRQRPEMSMSVTVLTGVALILPAAGLLLLALVGDNNPLQLMLPLVINLGALVLWGIAAIAWWRETAYIRFERTPSGDVARVDLVVTLILAATPFLLALLAIVFEFIP